MLYKPNMKAISRVTLSLLFASTEALNAFPVPRKLQSLTPTWWDLGMADVVLNEVALFFLGQSWYANTDVAEVLETIHRVNATDPWSWTTEWQQTAGRLEKTAEEFKANGNLLAAGQTFQRVATYYRASLHRHPDPFHEDVPLISQLAVNAFENFLELFEYPCESVKMPYEDTTLPGYLCINPDAEGPVPTIIFNEGRDGWAEDGKFVVDAAMKRGYNVLLWDGPGMGKTLRLQGLVFRHDWENVLGPVIDYLVENPRVDENNLALISVSLGGFLGPRAAVFDHRLKALVANPGVVNWFQVFEDALNSIDPSLMSIYEEDPNAFDEYMYQMMQYSDFLHWGIVDTMWHHGVSKPSELLAEIKRFNIEGMIQNITSATLVIDAELEERAQASELFEALSDDIEKEFLYFTAEEAAELHVQPGATAIMSARIFNWLDKVFESDATDSNYLGNAPGSNNSAGVSILSLPAFVAVAAATLCLVI